VDESIALAQRWGDLEELARGLFVRARILANTELREEMIEATFEALDAVERIRDLQPEGEVRARVFGRFADDYRRSANGFLGDPALAPAAEDIDRAFVVMERMRARSLLETLDAAGATVALLPETPLVEERAGVLEEAATIRRRLGSRELPNAERKELLNELADLEQREASLRDSISSQDPAFASVRGNVSISLREVQDALRPDQAMLAFQVQESIKDADQPFYSGAWVTAVTRSDVSAYPIPNGTETRSRIRLFLALLERRDGSGAHGAAQLYDDLLVRAIDGLPDGITSLVLIPDGPLHRLPFAALVDSATSSALAERFEIVVVPSAATWLRLRDGPTEVTRSTLLAFADPLRTAGKNGGEDLGPLPHARREAAALRRNVGGEARVLVGSEATETAFKKAERTDYALIHLAAHAVVNDEHPERSAVLLAQSDASDDDGLLDFGEVVALDLDGQLVLLSACRSASGPLIGGEGVMGLANAFFQAGARVVVAGLWRVRDRETALLIDRFGKHLARGSSVAAALANAKRDLIRRGAPPAAWAGMVVLGDGDLQPLEPKRSPFRAWILGGTVAAVAVLLVILLVLYRRR
jgi:CHAT domain-containing protein